MYTKTKFVLIFVGILFLLNLLAWQEIFILNSRHFLKVEFLNVGQGDSAFILTPGNHQILIDGGPDSTVLEKIAKSMPVWDKEIDLVILSHPERDHMQGVMDVLQRYKADYILWSGVKKNTSEYDKWIKVLEKQKNMGAKVIIAKSGQKIKAGNVLIDTVFPLENVEGKELKDTSNDEGVVLRLIFGKNSFLFTGDMSSVAEKELVNSGENILSDVLKVAHHGSKYSTSDLFLKNVKPAIAVIEVGKNSYGHPTQETLQRLDSFGARVLRTDQNGDITIISNGNDIYINNIAR